MEKVQVVYIAGMTRSGSTLLGRLLGELPNAIHVGELGLFTTPGFAATAGCECRRTVEYCEFWQAVYARAFGGLHALDLKELEQTRREYRLRALPRLLLPRTADQIRRLREYQDVLAALYSAVRDVSGADVIVDGTKNPFYCYLLSQVPTVDVKRVHLMRDPRAVAFSHQRVKKYQPLPGDLGFLPRFSPGQSAMSWNAMTLLLGAADDSRSLPLRYEDFVADPAGIIRRLWDFAGQPPPCLDFLEAPVLHLPPAHTVAGNPDRFQSEVRIRPDTEWQTKMPPRDRLLVTALTFPLLLRHGYLPAPKPTPDPAIQSASVL